MPTCIATVLLYPNPKGTRAAYVLAGASNITLQGLKRVTNTRRSWLLSMTLATIAVAVKGMLGVLILYSRKVIELTGVYVCRFVRSAEHLCHFDQREKSPSIMEISPVRSTWRSP
jgi:hypothetical protein